MSRAAIMSALFSSLTNIGAVRERNAAFAMRVPAGGLVILRDGDPGDPTVIIGRPVPIEIYEHAAELELYVRRPEDESQLYGMIDAASAAITSSQTLRDLVQYVEVAAPLVESIEDDGGDAIIAALVIVKLGYAIPRVAA